MDEHRSRPISIEEAYHLFILDCESRRFTASTLSYYHDRLGKFIHWVQAQQIARLQDLTNHHVKQYMVELQRRDLAGYSLLAAYRAIRRFCNFAVAEEWLSVSPMRNMKPPRVNKEIRRL